MRAFEYANPKTKEEAVKALTLDAGAAAPLSGGTDLLGLMKDDVEMPKRLVNLKSISELKGIRYDGKGLRIGALVTLDELIANKKITQEYSALAQAGRGIHSPQIQNVATVAGDLCQRPRCWYYRNGYGLLALQNGKSMVTEGDNRYHAILGNDGPAYFVSPSSFAVALISLGATVRVFGPSGAKDLPLAQFFRIPTAEGQKEYVLEPNQIITEVLVPPASRVKSAVYEVRQRECLDWPLATAAAALQLDGKSVKSARLVLGQVAPIPWLAEAAGTFLQGKTITAEVADQAAEMAVQGAKPLSKNAYKVRLARVAAKRAILRAAGMEA